MSFIVEYFRELWGLTLEMAPWLVLGFLFAGILKVYFPQNKVQKHLGKANLRSTITASVLGIPLPLCSCGVIPTGISFFKNGASKGATNSFLISTPQTGVDSILATYSLMGWPFALLRPLIAFVTGIVGGIVTNKIDKPKGITKNKQFSFAPLQSVKAQGSVLQVENTVLAGNTSAKTECNDSACKPKNSKNNSKLYEIFHYAFVEMVADIAKWLCIGLLLAALISVILPNDFFSNYIGSGFLEILIILAASVPLYICATGSIPIATVLLLKGVSPGAALVFLMAGPATNIATITVIGNSMGRKSLLAYLGSIIGGAILFGVLINEFIPKQWLLSQIGTVGDHNQGIMPYWLMLSTTILLLFCLIYVFIQWLLKRFAKGEERADFIILKVNGMTCNHCKNSIEKELSKLKQVELVDVNLAQKTVKIKGNISRDVLVNSISGIGFEIID